MADVDEAFAALQQLDEKGLTALRLAGAMWEETMRETAARVARAEWLLGRLHKWAADWGLIFDVSRAAAHWDAQHESQPPALGSRCQVLLAEQGQELRDLRMRLDEALDGREQAEIRAEKAERAPAGVNALLRGGGS
jgi:hypothetical protein